MRHNRSHRDMHLFSILNYCRWNSAPGVKAFLLKNLLLLSVFSFGDDASGESFSLPERPNSVIDFKEGDYRPLVNNTDFASGGSSPYYWETNVGGIWTPTGISPQSAKPPRIIVHRPGITGGVSSGNTYNDILVSNGGELILVDVAATPSQNFLNNNKTLEVDNGGKLIIRGDIKSGNSTFLIVRAGGSMILDQNSISNIHPMWNGTEIFEAGSTVTVKDWKWGAPTFEKSLIDNASSISNNANGYKFGHLIFDINPTSLWTIVSGSTGIINLCENDLYINNASSNFITGASNETGINGFVVNGNLTINKGPFSFGSSFSGGNFNHQFVVNGVFECRSSSVLKIHHSATLTPATLNGFVTFKNNVAIASTVSLFTNDAASVTTQPTKRMYINLDGGSSANPLLVDIAPTVFAISINMKSGSSVQLKGHDLDTKSTTGNTAIITIENLATLDFGWAPDGITALVIKKNGTGGTNNFVTQQGSILKITSPDGISETTAAGNVQYTSGTNKTFAPLATFWYIGKTNQVTGDGLSNTGNARQIIIDMADNSLSTTLTQPFSLTNTVTISSTGGKLDIRKGQFLETPTAYVKGVVNENGSGTLYMSPGTLYRISSLSSADVQPNIPRMSGVTFPYKLDGGTIELSAAGDQTLRGNKAYRNLTFSNSGTKSISSAPASITGTILIKDDAIVNVGANAMGGAGTNLTMEGNSKYITAGVLTKPDAQGTYTLGSSTSIEFANSNNLTIQDIRLGLSAENPIAYNHIIVSGNNVGNTSIASTPIMMQAGSTFTVLPGARFRHKNANGFSGASNTCLTNVPSIFLAKGSVIEYNRDNGTNQNITIQQPYQNLVLSGSGNKTAPADILPIEGNFSKTGTANFVHNNGTVLFNGNNMQTLSGSAPMMLFHNFTNDNSLGISIDNDVAVSKELRLKPGSTTVLNTGYIILKSDKNNTANVAEIPVSSTITYHTGGFVVERFINTGLSIDGAHAKSWQFLSTPAFGGTIRSTWQENKSAIANYGTIITNNDLTNWSSQGFDAYSAGGPSMKTYQALTNSWLGILNTGINLEHPNGYMIFIRGDRTVTGVGQDAKPTVLRAIGKLYSPHAGFQPESISVMPGRYQSVGNPYASSIDMEYMYDNGMMDGLDDSFFVWDPLLSGSYGVGGYQTISKLLGYKPVPGIPGNPTQYYDPAVKSNFIESGQAFFVHNSTGTNGTVTFTESCKANNSRLVHKEANQNNKNEILRSCLYTQNGIIADGNAVVFGDDFSNAIDHNDALKINNGGENFGLLRDQKVLAIEAKKRTNNDTIFFNTRNLASQTYQLRFTTENMRGESDAILIDKFLQSRTPVILADSSFYPFSITGDPASSFADRFCLILSRRTLLPLTFTSVKATRQDDAIIIKWKTANEINVSNYLIEKSGDGNNFTSVEKQAAKNALSNDYNWCDTKPFEGANYYRIRSYGTNNEISYSEIVHVFMAKENPTVNVFPNPVKDGILNLDLVNKSPGIYGLRLLNASGQLVISKQINHSREKRNEVIRLGKYAQGIYWLEIVKQGEEKIMIKVRIE